MKILIAIAFFITFLSYTNAASNVIFCYYGSWAGGRAGNGRFTISDINPKLCTHITYSFIGLSTNGNVKLLDSGALLPSFINLKNQNPKVKLLISMGGWNEGSATYSNVANSAALRTTFVNSVYDFMRKYGFDGFDFDWEYPAQRGGKASDKAAYIELLKALRAKFGTTYLLTAAVGATNYYISTSYDLINMNKYLDLINVMSYDFHGSWDGMTGQTSPLYASSADSNKELNQHSAMRAFLNAGGDRSKLVMGVAFYGRSYRLSSPGNNKIGAPTTGPGSAGPYTGESGTLSYLEVCEKLKTNGWTVVWDNEQQNPYAYSGYDWIGYDNVQSIRGKAQYAKNNQFAGIMIWSIESDDKNNICGGGAYPLLNAINSVFNTGAAQVPVATTTPSPGVPATTATTKAPSSGNPPIDCNAGTVQRDPYDCGTYYTCVKSGNTFVIYKQYCPSGLYFSTQSKACLYPSQVAC